MTFDFVIESNVKMTKMIVNNDDKKKKTYDFTTQTKYANATSACAIDAIN